MLHTGIELLTEYNFNYDSLLWTWIRGVWGDHIMHQGCLGAGSVGKEGMALDLLEGCHNFIP